MTANQNQQILDHLRQGYAITPLYALDMFGCFRLGARVWDLKKAGHPIEKRMVKSGDKKYAEYRMETK